MLLLVFACFLLGPPVFKKGLAHYPAGLQRKEEEDVCDPDWFIWPFKGVNRK